jgi:hypothetical protein
MPLGGVSTGVDGGWSMYHEKTGGFMFFIYID